MDTALEVVSPGPLSTVQDLGRHGLGALGVGHAGAADVPALRLANRLLGNPESAAAIEVTFGGLEVVARGGMAVTLTGAPCTLTVDGRAHGPYGVVWVPDGATLRLGPPTTGLRSYLAARGGIEVPARAGLPLHGRPVRGRTRAARRRRPAPGRPRHDGVPLRRRGARAAARGRRRHPARRRRSPGRLVHRATAAPRSCPVPTRSPRTATGSGCACPAPCSSARGTASSRARGWCAAPSRCRRRASRRSSSPTTRSPAGTPSSRWSSPPTYPSPRRSGRVSASSSAGSRAPRPTPSPPQEHTMNDVATLTPTEARGRFRAGLRVPTSGWCAGWTQANLLAVPRDLAYDFLLFAQRNPAPCPILDVTEPGRGEQPAVRGRPADGPSGLPDLRARRAGRRGRRRDRALARRHGGVPHRVQLHVRGRVARGRSARTPPRAGPQRPDVPHLRRLSPGRLAVGPDGRVDAPDGRLAGGHGGPGDVALPRRPRGAGPHRLAGRPRHHRPRQPPTSGTRWRCARERCRSSGPAASRRRQRSCSPARPWPSAMPRATWRSPTSARASTSSREGVIAVT